MMTEFTILDENKLIQITPKHSFLIRQKQSNPLLDTHFNNYIIYKYQPYYLYLTTYILHIYLCVRKELMTTFNATVQNVTEFNSQRSASAI